MSESLNQKYETLKAKLRNDRLKATENRNARQKEIADVRKTMRRIQYAARRQTKSSVAHAIRCDETNERAGIERKWKTTNTTAQVKSSKAGNSRKRKGVTESITTSSSRACKLMRSVGVQAESSNRRCNDDTLNSLQLQRPSSAVHTGVAIVQARSNKRKRTEGS